MSSVGRWRLSLNELHLSYYHTKDLIVRNTLVEEHMGLVHRYIYDHYPLFPDQVKEDMVIEGAIGLMDALEKYVPLLGHQFSTYAFYRIKKKVFSFADTYLRTLALSLEAQTESGASVMDFIADTSNDPAEVLMLQDECCGVQLPCLRRAMQVLTPRDMRILCDNKANRVSVRQLALDYCLSEYQIRRILEKSMEAVKGEYLRLETLSEIGEKQSGSESLVIISEVPQGGRDMTQEEVFEILTRKGR